MKGGDFMPTITVVLNIATTVSTLDAPTIAAVILWVQQNVIAKLPATATASVQNYNITP